MHRLTNDRWAFVFLIFFGWTLFAGMPLAWSDSSDWPQWRGPNRDGKAAPQLLLQNWPEQGPPLSWEATNLGRGYSSLAIVDGQIFTMGSDATDCFVICLDADTGTTAWQTTVSRAGTGEDYNAGWGAGPRSTPTIDGRDVFVVSDVGIVACLDRDTGDVRWSVDMVADYGGAIPKWGYSESVLVDDQRIVVTPG
ncbi:MAG: PQQ-binding-like beta-propeller repeat protein, partial [Planctomycetota bacterium]